MTCLYCVGSMEPRMDSNAETSSASLKPSLLPSLVPLSRSPSWSGHDFPAPAGALSNSYRRTRASMVLRRRPGAKHLLATAGLTCALSHTLCRLARLLKGRGGGGRLREADRRAQTMESRDQP